VGLDHIIAGRIQQFQTAHEVIKDICYSEISDTAGLFAMLIYQHCGITEMTRSGMVRRKRDDVWESKLDSYS
jgi:hypothetical protein